VFQDSEFGCQMVEVKLDLVVFSNERFAVFSLHIDFEAELNLFIENGWVLMLAVARLFVT
jgi:hypothetical protein